MKWIIFASFILSGLSVCTQSLEPAMAYNLLDRQNNADKYYVVGNYKVVGSPFLFGGFFKGSIFAQGKEISGTSFGYDVYLKEIEFNGASQKGTAKLCSEVDSFVLKSDMSRFFADLHFVNGFYIYAEDKMPYQVIATGDKYCLYKKYSGDLDVVSTNYVQSNLRQFTLTASYYLLDKQSKLLKKLKVTRKALKQEFGKIKPGIEDEIEDSRLQANAEEVLIYLLGKVNE